MKKVKEKDIVCSECGSVYPLKSNDFIKVHGFKYAYCFKCKMITRHQTTEPIDIYKALLESKDISEYTGKDKVLAKALKIK